MDSCIAEPKDGLWVLGKKKTKGVGERKIKKRKSGEVETRKTGGGL